LLRFDRLDRAIFILEKDTILVRLLLKPVSFEKGGSGPFLLELLLAYVQKGSDAGDFLLSHIHDAVSPAAFPALPAIEIFQGNLFQI
jgi:hypothetical protein